MALLEEGFYILYGNVYPVKGYCRCALYDLQFNKIEIIPNDIYVLLINGFSLRNYSLYQITFSIEDVENYINYLIIKDFVFHTYYPDLFPRIYPLYQKPSLITNVILEIDNKSLIINMLEDIFEQFQILNIKALEI
jgi:hypothetical protein